MHALIEIIEKIREALDKKHFTSGIFINLQKAFDTINHDILLDKLNFYGVKGISNMWFETFLKERYQYETIKKYNSEKLMSTQCATGISTGIFIIPTFY